MASKAATLGDPRRPQDVKRVSSLPALGAADDTLSQTFLVAAFCAGVMGIMLQSKVAVWAGVFLMMAGWTHMPYTEAHDAMRMLMLTSTMVMWSFVSLYLKHYLQPAALLQRQLQPQSTAVPPPPPAATPNMMMED